MQNAFVSIFNPKTEQKNIVANVCILLCSDWVSLQKEAQWDKLVCNKNLGNPFATYAVWDNHISETVQFQLQHMLSDVSVL